MTHLRRRDRVTDETIALVELAHLARIQSAPNNRDLRSQTARALQRDRNAYWKAMAVASHDTVKLYQMLKSVSRRTAVVGEMSLRRDYKCHPR